MDLAEMFVVCVGVGVKENELIRQSCTIRQFFCCLNELRIWGNGET